MLCERLLTVAALGLPLTEYVDDVTLFHFFLFKQKIHRTAQFIVPKYTSFIRICFQLVN